MDTPSPSRCAAVRIDLLTRRRLLRRGIYCALGLPLLGGFPLAGSRLLAATEEAPETDDNMEGPFYKPGAPVRSVLLERGAAGTPLLLSGRILDTQGRPIKAALLDLWQADHTGTYDNDGFKLRGRIYTDDDGRYSVRTIKPAAYGAPDDKRPSHIHVKASSGKSPVLTTQLYFKGDPWNLRDPSVRPSLIMAAKETSEGLTARFDFVIKSG